MIQSFLMIQDMINSLWSVIKDSKLKIRDLYDVSQNTRMLQNSLQNDSLVANMYANVNLTPHLYGVNLFFHFKWYIPKTTDCPAKLT